VFQQVQACFGFHRFMHPQKWGSFEPGRAEAALPCFTFSDHFIFNCLCDRQGLLDRLLDPASFFS